jgi:allophanate hydrolase subunit 2
MPLGPNDGYNLFTTGQVLTAAQVQHNMANQSVMFYASAAARDADTALTAALTEGMFCYLADTNITAYYSGSAWVPLFQNQVLVSPKEQAVLGSAAVPATVNIDVSTAYVQITTGAPAANFTLNVRGSASVTLDSLMAVNDSITVTFEHPNGVTAYYPTSVTIDGNAVTPKWLGGTAPSSGNASATDVYMLQIRKTGSATFTCIASQSKFA